VASPYTDRFVTTNGLRLHYQDWGDPHAPDVLFIHGWSTSAPIWHEIAEGLSRDYHVIVPDNRGNGESEVPSEGYRISDYADDLVGLIEAIGMTRPTLVGSSWGGNIGTYMAAEHPELISRAVLADPVYWKMIDAFATVVPKVTGRLDRPEGEVRAEVLAAGATSERAEREVYINYHFSPEMLRRISIENRDWALQCEGFLARASVPTLLLVADPGAGGYISEVERRHLTSVSSLDVEVRLWEGVGHLMHGEAPDRFVKELRDFLTTPN
jgi:pimeloyl-ACP methyl ester carboxylesterase